MFKKILAKKPEEHKHLAIYAEGIFRYFENGNTVKSTIDKTLDNIRELVKFQVQRNIPIVSLYLNIQDFIKLKSTDEFAGFMRYLYESELVNANKIKITVLGKWYDLSGVLVQSLREASEETRHYDQFFFNLYINYDGQSEILDVFKLLSMQVKEGKIAPKDITKNLIKENLYSSYFVPPDKIIYCGKYNRGFLLWDSVNSKMQFKNITWPEFEVKEV